jgi:methyltransferase (TIGR00027 family)
MTATGSSSPSALAAAAARAAHLIVDGPPVIFADSLAERLLGADAEELLAYHRLNGTHVVLASARAQATCRSHLAEDALAAGVDKGIRQFVILGAGLDSFAYRSALADRVVTFEVDHPASQEAKRQRLSAAHIATPHRVTFVPVDFEVDPLTSRLAAAGFDPGLPAIVTWLGVSMYLTRDGIAATIGELGSLAPGSELLMDYMVPSDLRDDAARTYVELVGPVTAARGEPWLTFLSPQELSQLLADGGFHDVVHTGQGDLEPELWHRTDSLRPSNLSLIAHASR